MYRGYALTPDDLLLLVCISKTISHAPRWTPKCRQLQIEALVAERDVDGQSLVARSLWSREWFTAMRTLECFRQTLRSDKSFVTLDIWGWYAIRISTHTLGGRSMPLIALEALAPMKREAMRTAQPLFVCDPIVDAAPVSVPFQEQQKSPACVIVGAVHNDFARVSELDQMSRFLEALNVLSPH